MTDEQDKQVTISKKEYEILLDEKRFLEMLEDLGISNLPIYQDAINRIEGEDEVES